MRDAAPLSHSHRNERSWRSTVKLPLDRCSPSSRSLSVMTVIVLPPPALRRSPIRNGKKGLGARRSSCRSTAASPSSWSLSAAVVPDQCHLDHAERLAGRRQRRGRRRVAHIRRVEPDLAVEQAPALESEALTPVPRRSSTTTGSRLPYHKELALSCSRNGVVLAATLDRLPMLHAHVTCGGGAFTGPPELRLRAPSRTDGH